MRHQTQRAHWSVLVLLAAVLVVGLVAPTTQAAPAAQTGNVLSIGYLGMAGQPSANGAQLAINQINAIGGVTAADGTSYTLELLTMPAPPTPDNLGAAITDFTNLGVVAMLGPDTNALITASTLGPMSSSIIPIISSATTDQLASANQGGYVFRARAPEHSLSYALAAYLSEDLNLSAMVLVQTDVSSTESLISFEAALNELQGRQPTDKIQVPSGSDLTDQIARIVSASPQVVVLWGPTEDAVTLLRGLRDAGWNGQFAYRYADQLVRAGLLTDAETDGMLGMDSWSYATLNDATRIFVRDYVTTFGQVPTARAAAAYDALWFLRGVIGRWGATPPDIQAGLSGGAPQTLVQGTLHPIEFGNGDLARLTVVYKVTEYGGQEVVARFDDVSRLPVAPVEEPEEEATPEPTATIDPLVTIFPTPTVAGAWARVTVNTLNVRSGPGFDYDKVGEVSLNEEFRILGAIPDYSWVLIDVPGLAGNVGWIKTEFAETFGDLASVSIVAPPPTPTIGATLTPSPPPIADIVIDAVNLSPAQLVPNKPFTATVTVRNAGGGAAGRFAVAATFQPGGVYISGFVDGLAAGQTSQVQLSGTLTGTGVFTEAIVADLNQEVQEASEDNNVYNLAYRVDYPLFTQQANIQLTANTEWDLYGGVPDVRWDGFNLEMRNGSTIGLLGGTYPDAHYDMLTPGLINNTIGLTTDQALVNGVYGLYLSEGQRAVLRIDNRQGETIWISYRVYNNNP